MTSAAETTRPKKRSPASVAPRPEPIQSLSDTGASAGQESASSQLHRSERVGRWATRFVPVTSRQNAPACRYKTTWRPRRIKQAIPKRIHSIQGNAPAQAAAETNRRRNRGDSLFPGVRARFLRGEDTGSFLSDIWNCCLAMPRAPEGRQSNRGASPSGFSPGTSAPRSTIRSIR